MSYAFPHPGGGHTELIAVLRNRTASDLHPAFAKDIYDRLIRERLFRILFLYQLLQLRLDATGGNVFAVRGSQSGRKEELERKNSARGLDELLVGDSADGGFVHVDDLRNLAEGEGLQVLNSLLEELALPLHDVVHHLEHCLATLLDGLDHPVCRVELVGDELLVLAVEFLFIARDLLVGPAQLESREIRIIQKDVIPVVDFFYDQVRDDVVVIA